jgi:hypothetical protein
LLSLTDKIIVLDNILTKEECRQAIKIFNFFKVRRVPEFQQYRDTFILEIVNDDLSLLTNKIVQSIMFATNDITSDWSQIVEWRVGSKQEYHKDTARDDTVFTSITYLNDDYTGGETQFLNDIKIVPKVGRTVYFDGNHYFHGVNEIKSGVRYTLPIWYKKISVV